MLGWFLSTYLLLEFGSSSVTEYRTLFKQERYLTMVAVPLALLAGAGFVELHGIAREFVRKKYAATLAVMGALATVVWGSLGALSVLGAWPRQTRAELHEIRDVVREHEGETMYVMHWLWNTRVGFYLKYADDYVPSGYAPYQAVLLGRADPTSLNRYVQTLAPGEPMSRGILLLDEHLLQASIGERKIGLVGPGEVPEVLLHPPPEWRFLRRVQRVAIYEIPEGARWPGDPGPPGPVGDALTETEAAG
jgi:hypothetical protein